MLAPRHAAVDEFCENSAVLSLLDQFWTPQATGGAVTTLHAVSAGCGCEIDHHDSGHNEGNSKEL